MKSFAKQTMTMKVGAVAVLFLGFCLIYLLSLTFPSGWWTFGLSLPPLIVVLLTAIARVNDITQDTIRWHARRIGLLGVAGGCIAVLLQAFQFSDFPSWSEVLMYWGFATTWLTTPNMPPWWQFIAESIVDEQETKSEPPL